MDPQFYNRWIVVQRQSFDSTDTAVNSQVFFETNATELLHATQVTVISKLQRDPASEREP